MCDLVALRVWWGCILADPVYALTGFFEEPVPAEDAADWAHAIGMM
ncbi:MAG TPA: hypothetical protein VND68_01180 [Chloroflexia bacterium]|nr:hypothetical protein [Chloroflexia bacterium]